MRSPDNREHPARRATVIALFLLWAFLLFAVYLTYQVSAVLALLLLATLITQFWPILHELVTDLPRMITPTVTYTRGTDLSGSVEGAGVGGWVLGEVDYARDCLRRAGGDQAEQTDARRLVRSGRMAWEQWVKE